MAKEIRVGKTTKLIRETEKDISGLPLLVETEDTSVKNPIPEEITAPIADITETVIEDETLHHRDGGEQRTETQEQEELSAPRTRRLGSFIRSKQLNQSITHKNKKTNGTKKLSS